MNLNVVTVESTATELAQVASGQQIFIQNLSGSETVFLGPSSSVAANAGIALAAGTPGGWVSISYTNHVESGDTWYAITSTGTASVVVMVSS